jgi:peptidoglycan hydrolase CwlO-like protein
MTRVPPTLSGVAVVLAVLVAAPLALAQSVSDAESDASRTEERVEQAQGFVDEAVANREQIELELAASIEKVNELSAKLSEVGAGLDRIADQLGYADIELAGIQEQIESQAVDAYMTILASPTMSLVGTRSVEKAMVASSVVEGVVNSGKEAVDELFIKRRSLEELQSAFLKQKDEYTELESQVNAEVEHLAELYEQADASVAEAVRTAQQAELDHRAALSAVELARAKEKERERQENRGEGTSPTTTTVPGSTNTTSATTTTSPPATTAPDATTTTEGGGGGWTFPPHIEQWRSLVSQYFPASRVDEALAVLRCESNGDPDAYNPYSGASGLFQFLPSTWATTSGPAGFGGASPFDAEANIGTAAWLGSRYQQLGQYFWAPWSCKRVL